MFVVSIDDFWDSLCGLRRLSHGKRFGIISGASLKRIYTPKNKGKQSRQLPLMPGGKGA